MNARFIPWAAFALAAACLPTAGCHSAEAPSTPAARQNDAAAANALFLNQKTFDPWVLTSPDPNSSLPAYISNGKVSKLYAANGTVTQTFQAGNYVGGQLAAGTPNPVPSHGGPQTLDMRDGTFTAQQGESGRNWPKIWQTSDIIIRGDPEAQQVTHANLFYLLSSAYPGSPHSIPPMGLSSNLYGGHIFWDAEIFMLPALIVQHPDYAKSIIDYRFQRLGQAKKNAAAHGFQGAEYPWESADTGQEMVGAEFARERHITADVAWAAWQYYLWTGDQNYLKTEGWPLLSAAAEYWVSRVTKSADGKYHIQRVLGPDETAGVTDDDAWTNGIVQATLRAAAEAAKDAGQTVPPQWAVIANGLFFPTDPQRGIPAENSRPLTDRFAAKQADTLLLAYPLSQISDPAIVRKTLDFYAVHTIKTGPAMTASMESVIAARLGRGQQSLDLFHDSYRPFMRGPWDAFAEKRTSSRVYFCTGMGGCLQSVLYGFGGLNFAGRGTKIAGELSADPHLPPGWGGLTLKGVQYHGKVYDVAIAPGNTVTVRKVP